mmetsp:Transcript_13065/g.19638  ORF Transcript_13065/g.19638 Transcript_13065/m.19638 type:complete len:222 (-) Transcript_13065:50-715(-)
MLILGGPEASPSPDGGGGAMLAKDRLLAVGGRARALAYPAYLTGGGAMRAARGSRGSEGAGGPPEEGGGEVVGWGWLEGPVGGGSDPGAGEPSASSPGKIHLPVCSSKRAWFCSPRLSEASCASGYSHFSRPLCRLFTRPFLVGSAAAAAEEDVTVLALLLWEVGGCAVSVSMALDDMEAWSGLAGLVFPLGVRADTEGTLGTLSPTNQASPGLGLARLGL